MRRLHIDYPLVATAFIALLLLAYVFAGGTRSQSNPQLRCASPQALDQIKRELFRRAAVMRGENEPGFATVASYAVLRPNSQVLRDAQKPGAVNCSASMMLDLPPGVEVVGGRRSLGAKVSYTLRADSAGKPQLGTLNNADAIVQPLATVGQIGSQPGAPLMPVGATQDTSSSESAEAVTPPADPAATSQVQPSRPQAQPARRTAPAPPSPPATAAPARASSVKREASRAASRTAPPPRRESPAAPRRDPEVVANPQQSRAALSPAPQPVTRPSFNCRYARTRGEIAVCRNPGLAGLDRQMSQRFYGALATASPGAKQLLQRSRNRFLRSRDSCGSEECIAAAYRARIAEINEIANRF